MPWSLLSLLLLLLLLLLLPPLALKLFSQLRSKNESWSLSEHPFALRNLGGRLPMSGRIKKSVPKYGRLHSSFPIKSITGYAGWPETKQE